jgi:LysR family cys regulon transcriptional activator
VSDRGLQLINAEHLFEANTVWLGLKRSQLQRNYVWRFIELCNQSLSINEIKEKVFKQPQNDSDVVIDYQI